MTGESRAAPAELSALRRVATLVAEGVQPLDLFAVVAEEVARVVDVPIVGIARYESDDTATECASYSPEGPLRPLGRRWSLEGTSVLRLVRESSKPARIDDYSQLEGEIADTVRRSGIRSSAASPIVVEGRLWGVMVVSSRGALPPDTEERLEEFTELVGTAIANAESREALARLADEQSALRQVATLVAQGVPPDKLFLAVSDEVRRLFGTEVAAVARFVPNVPALDVIGLGSVAEERWELEDWMATAQVRRSGRSARAEAGTWASAQGPAAERIRTLGVVSTVASPIVVEGELWGAIFVGSTVEALPLDTEQRLEKFTELVAMAIANAESRSELTGSRRRIVAASDEARRRIERDLHDGTQQRLISLALAVRAAQNLIGDGASELRSALSEVAQGLADAVNDLQELSRGIHPAILAHGGLGPALRELAHRSTIPVALDVAIDERLPEQVEIAAYFVVSEALANTAKHARASRIDISAGLGKGGLLLSIDDDGVGGVDPHRGSGLTGLSDRVEALGGSIRVRSRSGEGTHIVVELPLEHIT
ncbi:MAG TPA: GAF domain-containing sensor histidine kinase [Gaiellaceae bacterium]|nr:GAF domain-containing sensor histidine kinase [Gaiellaceae bacterium]